MFRRLSVFVGSFTLEAAQEVAGEEDVFGLLGRLVEQSLVTVETVGNEARYGMLEPVRQYAAELLCESDDAEAVRVRHARYYLSLFEAARPELRGAMQVTWLDWLELENGHLRVGIAWALEREEHETAARLGWALWFCWRLRDHHNEGRRWMDQLLERDLPPSVRAVAATVAAAMAFAQGDYTTFEVLNEDALALTRQVQDKLREAYPLIGLGLLAMHRADYEVALSRFGEVLPLLRDTGEEGMEPVVGVWMAQSCCCKKLHQRSCGFPGWADAGAPERRQGRKLQRALQHWGRWHSLSVTTMGPRRRSSKASPCRLRRRTGPTWHASRKDWRLHPARLAIRLGAAEEIAKSVGAPVYNDYRLDRSLYERAIPVGRSNLGEQAFEGVRSEGRNLAFADDAAELFSESP